MHYEIKDNQVVFTVQSQSESLYLKGTFTNWLIKEDFRFIKSADGCRLIKHLDDVNKIGNSGFIEYVIWDDIAQVAVDISPAEEGYLFNNQCNGGLNQLLFLHPPTKDELAEISGASRQSFHIKNQKGQFSSDAQLANFRTVSGGKLKPNWVYRSYHPVIASRENHPELKHIEPVRQAKVLALMEQHQIENVINLSDTNDKLKQLMPVFPESYYKHCWKKGRINSIPVAYETVYFMSDRNEPLNDEELGFEDGICGLIATIANKSGPYLVHCRLGSDRTGVICAFLQLLMGASKQDIAENYLETNQLGIGEYRSFRLLERALQAAVGDDCFQDGEEKVRLYLLSLGLPISMIEKAKKHLS
ncbi:tyrosine-protein phosphatase [Photobacterium rosenbergii]|uniref:Tyrosine-protein phosphatase n=1 Tax=Photobacterium rosenbergii TaxID=294936 RepID=A0ABU3ZJQ3_9GAMM|nr:tyrosine-protein phosphatase [Photobacterium rosenbergii]MDV5170351.1 tyrosine-protein phosphatase [Photobacterium rosenbergii]